MMQYFLHLSLKSLKIPLKLIYYCRFRCIIHIDSYIELILYMLRIVNTWNTVKLNVERLIDWSEFCAILMPGSALTKDGRRVCHQRQV